MLNGHVSNRYSAPSASGDGEGKFTSALLIDTSNGLLPGHDANLSQTDAEEQMEALQSIHSEVTAWLPIETRIYKNNFEEVKVLGKGMFGVVYQCRHVDGIHYAIKKLKMSSWDQGNINTVLSEAHTLAELNHENITRLYNWWVEPITRSEQDTMAVGCRSPASSSTAGATSEPTTVDGNPSIDRQQHGPECPVDQHFSSDGTPSSKALPDLWLYIQMQYCSGKTLREWLHERSEVDVRISLQVFSQIARGVEYVHGKAMIHRDLRPNNCFLMGDGTVKVGDFGSCRSVAKVASRHGDNEPCQYNYASPERWAGGDYGQKTDVYSLGAMLFEMCHPVFETAKERVDALRNLREERLPPNWTLPETHPSVAQLVLSMLALEPDRRPSASQAAIEAERLSTEQMASADSGHRGWSRLIGLVTQIFLCCVKTSSHKR